jgi:ubiquinone/menaquinone biosynthesis C-methylase UbiE
MDLLGVSAGKSVADIGAGSGWFTVRAARRVGDAGMVYAADINPHAIQYINDRVRKEQLTNVKIIVSRADDAMLPADSVDSVLLLKTYHEVAHPVTLLRNLRGALRPGAKVGIIDRNGNGEDHGIDGGVVIREAKEADYRLIGQYDFVKVRQRGLLSRVHGSTVTSSTTDQVLRLMSTKAGRSASDAAPSRLAQAASRASQSSK